MEESTSQSSTSDSESHSSDEDSQATPQISQISTLLNYTQTPDSSGRRKGFCIPKPQESNSVQ